jgi:hypothetical protein
VLTATQVKAGESKVKAQMALNPLKAKAGEGMKGFTPTFLYTCVTYPSFSIICVAIRNKYPQKASSLHRPMKSTLYGVKG